MTPALVRTDDATADLLDILDYIAARNAGASDRYILVDRVGETIDILAVLHARQQSP